MLAGRLLLPFQLWWPLFERFTSTFPGEHFWVQANYLICFYCPKNSEFSISINHSQTVHFRMLY